MKLLKVIARIKRTSNCVAHLGLDVTNVKLLSCSQKNSAHIVDENPPRFKSKNLLQYFTSKVAGIA